MFEIQFKIKAKVSDLSSDLFRFPQTNMLCTFLIPTFQLCFVLYPSHPPQFDHPNNLVKSKNYEAHFAISLSLL